MDFFEKMNRSFGTWYEGLFGASDDVRPRDVLRKIITALEDNRKEGFDNRVYVPNQYILELMVTDEEEKEYLLSFLDRDELEAAVRRYCKQSNYVIRGPLDFTVREVEEPQEATRKSEKVRVKCRYNSRITSPESPPDQVRAQQPPVEERTVASARANYAADELGTVAAVSRAYLVVYPPDRPPHRFALSRGSAAIGRSAHAENDVVVESDGQVSKRHARIEFDADGRFTIYDLDSTNGIKVNGRRVANRTLNDGDEISLGNTRIVFYQPEKSQEDHATPPHVLAARGGVFGGAAEHLNGSTAVARLILTENGRDLDDYLLASETLIGRGLTNDIVLPDRSIATRHARIINSGDTYKIECLSDTPTFLNQRPLRPGEESALADGDRIRMGDLQLRFECPN